ncbi:MAG: ATP-binding protein, partial [Candidatus Nealsonbacteria bacterium]|nr:ATP-binding protein [Candidatus Nealsonbacteria bacterium]
MPKTKEIEPKKKAKTTGYEAKDIYVLEGLDPVRKRPGMYIGSTGSEGLHHLIWEVIDNSLDECMAGYAKNIEVVLLPGNKVKTSDDGRGIPVDKHPQTKKSALETVMTTLHAGGKFGGEAYKISGGLHGVGVSVVCALSINMKAEVCRGGERYEQEYVKGKAKANVKKVGSCKSTGTIITFEPDPEIFKEIKFDLKAILEHLRQQAYLTRGIRIIVIDSRNHAPESYTFYFEGGLQSYVKYLVRGSSAIQQNVFYTSNEKDDILVEAAFQYTKDREFYEDSFANNINTGEGGAHVTGFRSALTRSLNDYARKNNFLKESEENLTGEDVRDGFTGVVSIKLREPQFEGQTKAKLGNPEAKAAVEAVVSDGLTDFLERNPQDARAIIENCLLTAKARRAAKAARQTVLRKGALEGLALPGKLADCSSRKPEESELFIVEGDSAGGCFSGDTKVALTDGRNLSFRQLIHEYKKGKKNYCYSIEKDGTIGIELIESPRLTKNNTEVVKVVLDNDEEIICTPNHKIMLRDGSYREAENLTPQDSLMPLKRQFSQLGKRITIKGYELVYDNKEKRWVFTHILADNYNLRNEIYPEVSGYHKHHIDFNKLNNNP